MTEHDHDSCRLDALAELDILDTPSELAFDRITGLARKIFSVRMAALTFIDGHRQWRKSELGLGVRETERRPALCNYAIRQETPLVIPDASLDPRFVDNVFVRSSPFIRFYAGAPIRVSNVNIGTLCVMDTSPREFGRESVEILSDLAAVAVDELLLRNISMQDSLTGALSRRAFGAEGERLASLANRHGQKLVVAILDVDHFKSVNDRHGHAVGDVALSAVVDICKENLRATDVIGRLGGEEFGIILPHTDLARGMNVTEKARLAIAARPIETPYGSLQITCSFGSAEFTPGQDFDGMLRNADLAMYAAKNAGRNRAVAWIEPVSSISPAKRRVFKAGQITFNAGNSTFDCTVRALRNETATIEVISTAAIPEQFKLAIASDGLSRACRAVSKSDKRIEVAFL